MQRKPLHDCQGRKLGMKKSLLLAFSFAVYLTSCKKSVPGNTSIIATWELSKVAGQLTINYPAGNGTKWKFTEDSYEFYSNNVLQKSGTYSLVNDNTVSQSVCIVFPANQFSRRIIFDNHSDSAKVFIEIAGNKLSMVSGCFAYDAGSIQEYIKK